MTTEAPAKKKFGCVTWVILFVIAGLIATCSGLLLITMAGPGWVLGRFLDDEPLKVDPPVVAEGSASEIRARIAEDARDGSFTITPGEINALLPRDDDNVAVMQVASDGAETGELTVSVRMEDFEGQYLNLHVVGGFDMVNGFFQTLTIDDLVVGGWHLGTYVANGELAEQANQNLAQQRVQDPEMAQTLSDIRRATIVDGALYMEVSEPTLTEILQAMGQ